MFGIALFEKRNFPTEDEIRSIIPRLVSTMEETDDFCESEYKIILFYRICMSQKAKNQIGIFNVIKTVDQIFRRELEFDVFGNDDETDLSVRNLYFWYEITNERWLTQKTLFFSTIASQSTQRNSPFVLISPSVSSETLHDVLPVFKNGSLSEMALKYIIDSLIDFHDLSRTINVFRSETQKVIEEFVTLVGSTGGDFDPNHDPESDEFEIDIIENYIFLTPFKKYGNLFPERMMNEKFTFKLKNRNYFQIIHGNDFLKNSKLFYLIQYISAVHMTLMRTNVSYSADIIGHENTARWPQIRCIEELSQIPIAQQILNTAFMKLYMGPNVFGLMDNLTTEIKREAKKTVDQIEEFTTREKVKELIDLIKVHPSTDDKLCRKMDEELRKLHLPEFGVNEYIYYWRELQYYYQHVYKNRGSLWEDCCPFSHGLLYDYNSQEIFVSSFYLNMFYSQSIPEPVKYAQLGSIIGEGIFHSIDPHAMKDSSWQNLLHWGSETKNKYDKFLSCLLHVFNEANVNEANLNLADSFANSLGLKAAYNAFQANKKLGKTEKLSIDFPGLHNHTAEQLFFVAWAQRFRTVSVNSSVVLGSDTKDLPDWLRVNQLLSMNSEFVKFYECQQTDNMVSSHKCELW